MTPVGALGSVSLSFRRFAQVNEFRRDDLDTKTPPCFGDSPFAGFPEFDKGAKVFQAIGIPAGQL